MARILLVLAVLFAMCWLPYNVMMLAMDLLDLDVETQQWLLNVSSNKQFEPVHIITTSRMLVEE